MDEARVVPEKNFLKQPLVRPKKEFKVKCLGWCDKEFLSESKFVRFCEKCRSKKNKIAEDNYYLDNEVSTKGLGLDPEKFEF